MAWMLVPDMLGISYTAECSSVNTEWGKRTSDSSVSGNALFIKGNEKEGKPGSQSQII